MTEIRDVVFEVLAQLGSSREAQHYLKAFSTVDDARFAVVKVGGGILQDNMEELASALAFLHRLGLRPIVLHGAGPQVSAALADANVKSEWKDNLRVTTQAVMQVARPVVYQLNHRLVESLENRGIRARGLQHGIFQAQYLDEERYGLVGDVTAVNIENLQQIIASGAMPVLTCFGESPSGQVFNINADIATRELVWAIRPYKVIFLTPSGGLLDRHGRVISAVSLNNDYEALMKESWVHSGMRLKLQQIHDMLQVLDDSASVSITSARKLTRELFTYRGAGTLIRKGEAISVYEKPDEDLMCRVLERIQTAFKRKLRPDWLQTLDNPVVLLSASERAAAIVVQGQDNVPYLEKFFVTPDAQGEGLGAAIWQSLRARYPAIYWRSRQNNPITPWYFSQSDTSDRHGAWVVFTNGVKGIEKRDRLVQHAIQHDSGWEDDECLK